MPNQLTQIVVEISNTAPLRAWSRPRLTVLDYEETNAKTTPNPVELGTPTTGPS